MRAWARLAPLLAVGGSSAPWPTSCVVGAARECDGYLDGGGAPRDRAETAALAGCAAVADLRCPNAYADAYYHRLNDCLVPMYPFVRAVADGDARLLACSVTTAQLAETIEPLAPRFAALSAARAPGLSLAPLGRALRNGTRVYYAGAPQPASHAASFALARADVARLAARAAPPANNSVLVVQRSGSRGFERATLGALRREAARRGLAVTVYDDAATKGFASVVELFAGARAFVHFHGAAAATAALALPRGARVIELTTYGGCEANARAVAASVLSDGAGDGDAHGDGGVFCDGGAVMCSEMLWRTNRAIFGSSLFRWTTAPLRLASVLLSHDLAMLCGADAAKSRADIQAVVAQTGGAVTLISDADHFLKYCMRNPAVVRLSACERGAIVDALDAHAFGGGEGGSGAPRGQLLHALLRCPGARPQTLLEETAGALRAWASATTLFAACAAGGVLGRLNAPRDGRAALRKLSAVVFVAGMAGALTCAPEAWATYRRHALGLKQETYHARRFNAARPGRGTGT